MREVIYKYIYIYITNRYIYCINLIRDLRIFIRIKFRIKISFLYNAFDAEQAPFKWKIKWKIEVIERGLIIFENITNGWF